MAHITLLCIIIPITGYVEETCVFPYYSPPSRYSTHSTFSSPKPSKSHRIRKRFLTLRIRSVSYLRPDVFTQALNDWQLFPSRVLRSKEPTGLSWYWFNFFIIRCNAIVDRFFFLFYVHLFLFPTLNRYTFIIIIFRRFIYIYIMLQDVCSPIGITDVTHAK